MKPNQLRRKIPWWIAAGRLALGPLMVAGEAAGWRGALLALAVVVALVSDIFDGVLARRWRCDTPAVRLFDSMADTIFYGGTGLALWLRHPPLVRGLAWPLAVVGGLELSRFAIEVAKFGKPASYHSRLAKLWGLCLANAALLGFLATSDITVRRSWLLALIVGMACDAEGFAMSLVLPRWRKDLPDFQAAWHLRTSVLLQHVTGSPAPPTLTARRAGHWLRRAVAPRLLCLLGLALVVTSVARAERLGPATWLGGTAPGLVSGAVGQIDIATPERLAFHPENGPELEIPYSSVQSFSYRCAVRHHLGVLPAIAVAWSPRGSTGTL